MKGEQITLKLDIDEFQLKAAKSNIDSMKGEYIPINLDVDTSQLESSQAR